MPLLVVIFAVDFSGTFTIALVWYVIVGFIMLYQFAIKPLRGVSISHRLMLSVLAQALKESGSITPLQLTYSQNQIVGRFTAEEFKKTKRLLRSAGVHLSDYIDENEFGTLPQHTDLSVFHYLSELDDGARE